MPDVVGLAEPAAVILIALKHLQPQRRATEHSPHERGKVLRTEPAGGARVQRDSTVVYWVASGENVVPDVTRRPLEGATAMLERTGFRPGTTSERFDRGRAGVVLAQDPAADSVVPVGSAVDLVVSTDLVAVPDIVGSDESLAIRELDRSQLGARREGEEASTQARGTVLRTQPAADARVRHGTPVAYWIASGENQVPDLRGLTTEEARSTLESAEFLLGTIGKRADLGTAGLVLEQSPSAGGLAQVGSPVLVMISSELRVPTIVGMSADEAQAELLAAGLVPQLAGSDDSILPRDEVVHSDPAAGTRVLEGAQVAYRVASGRNQVPDVGGRSAQEAAGVLGEAGFMPGPVSTRADPGESGLVLEQDPLAGTLADVGSEVALTVSGPLSAPPVPDAPPPPPAPTAPSPSGPSAEGPGTTPPPPMPSTTVIAGAGVMLLALGGAWWTQLRPWPLKLPLQVSASLEPVEATDRQWPDPAGPVDAGLEVGISVHLEPMAGIPAASVPVSRVEET